MPPLTPPPPPEPDSPPLLGIPQPLVNQPFEGDEFITGALPVYYAPGTALMGVGDGTTKDFSYAIPTVINWEFPISVVTDADSFNVIPISVAPIPEDNILVGRTELRSIQRDITQAPPGTGTIDQLSRIVTAHFNVAPKAGVKVLLSYGASPQVAVYLDGVKLSTVSVDVAQTQSIVLFADGFFRTAWLWSLDLSTLPVVSQLVRRQRITARTGWGEFDWTEESDPAIALTQFFQKNLVNYVPPEYVYLDFDSDLQVFLKVFAITLDELKDYIDSFPEVFDIDRCDPKYLPVIAQLLGYEFNRSDSVESQRRQLRTAVAWYKVKGTFESFRILFYALGYRIKLYELWTTTPLAQAPIVADPLAESTGAGWAANYHFFSSVLPGYPEGTPADDVPPDDPNLIENGGTWYRSPHFAIELNAIEEPINLPPEMLRYILGRIHQIRPAHTVLDYLRFIISMSDAYGQIEDDLLLEGILSFSEKGWYAAYCDPDDPIYLRNDLTFPPTPAGSYVPPAPTRNGSDAAAIHMKRYQVIGICHPGEELLVYGTPDMTDIPGLQLVRNGMTLVPQTGSYDITTLDRQTFPLREQPNWLNDPIFRDGDYRYLNVLQIKIIHNLLVLLSEFSSHEIGIERAKVVLTSELDSALTGIERSTLTIFSALTSDESVS